jgi:hypothetical protein
MPSIREACASGNAAAQAGWRNRMPADRLRQPSGASGQSWVFGGGSADQAWDNTAGCDSTGGDWLAGMEDGGSSRSDEGAASGMDEA